MRLKTVCYKMYRHDGWKDVFKVEHHDTHILWSQVFDSIKLPTVLVRKV